MKFIYSKKDFQSLLSKSPLIVMDTNVLLDFYGYTLDTLKNIISSFEKHSNLFWLPHQVYQEFSTHYKNIRERDEKRFQNLYSEISNIVSDTIGKITSKYNEFNKHKFPEIEDCEAKIAYKLRETLDFTKTDLEKLQIEHNKKIMEIKKQDDQIYKFVKQLITHNEFKEFSILELIDIFEEGEKRYKYKMPPGYTDSSKQEKNEAVFDHSKKKYGDLIIWKEILRKIKGKSLNLILIQNELKKDWWVRDQNKQNKIPLILEQEFHKESANNSTFHMVSFDEFISHTGIFFSVNPNSVLEITNRMNFIREIESYLKSNITTLIIKYIDNQAQEFVLDNIHDTLFGKSFMSGIINDAEDIDILDTKVIKNTYHYDQDECQVIIDTEVIIKVYALLTITTDNGSDFTIPINAIFNINAFLIFNIDNDKTIDKAIIFETIEFNKTKMKEIDVDYLNQEENEDDNNYINTCPDCGNQYTFEDDGGGFCKDCAVNH